MIGFILKFIDNFYCMVKKTLCNCLGLCIVLLLSGFNSAAQNSPVSSPDDAWTQLFDGKDLHGWKQVGPGTHLVTDGMIASHGGMGLLYCTKGKFSNCIIKVVYQMQKSNSNSGVFIRIPLEPREAWMPVFYGYEVQIDNHPETSNENEYHVTGTLYSLTKPLAKPGKPGPEWNTMEITLDGLRTIVYLNGEKVTDYKEGDPTPERKFDFEPYRGLRPLAGYIGLQNHGDDDIVYFKEVAVKQLPKDSKMIDHWQN